MRSRVLMLATILVATMTLSAAESGKTFGAGVTVEKATPIADLLKNPEQFAGKAVRVDGTIAAVCEEMGCWIQLEDPASKAAIRCKVEDGVIVFPVSAKGKKAAAQGTLERIGDDPETAKHMAEQKADPSKPAEPHGTPKGAVYQLRTTGAVVYRRSSGGTRHDIRRTGGHPVGPPSFRRTGAALALCGQWTV